MIEGESHRKGGRLIEGESDREREIERGRESDRGRKKSRKN